ncbi:hypothetical protein QNI23_004420 [Bermanella sp. WJH001]|uniref:hypothetical protein n=1 Tax=Bermanella sp. WJH001 TaxID=3048005 RepID=UPI0024BE3EB4|nr:hypothetical protein [Bermanella sp. WJH001]MDJ1539726.1 hypothetical protein [Bermanella sp. WJH001]
MKINSDLMVDINEELSKSNIEHSFRPLRAIALASDKLGISISIPSAEADFIFRWYEFNGKPGSQLQGHFHQGLYYFDSEFWSVSIPLIYGQIEVNSLEALHNMPSNTKASLTKNNKTLWDYVIYWADCIDFGYAYDDLRKSKEFDTFGINLLNAGYEELSSATSLLLESRPNKRAIMNCRMATEMLLKSFICLKEGLSETQAKKLGHDLSKLLDKFIDCSGYDHLKKIKPLLSVFPSIHERYSEQTATHAKIFDAYCFAQSIGALIAREFTDRDTLSQIMPSNNHMQPPLLLRQLTRR